MTNVASPPSVNQRSQGRGYFLLGIFVCLLGLGLVAAQFFALKYAAVPWYSPALATLGALLLLISVARRGTIPRVIALLLVVAFAGFQWYFLVSLIKLPAYTGPAQAGKQFPAFTASLADGRAYSDVDLRDGSSRVMTFFRGRW